MTTSKNFQLDLDTARALALASIEFVVEDVVVDSLLNMSVGYLTDATATDGRGASYYRPFWVAAHLVMTKYQLLQKADSVTFNYADMNKVTENLLGQQAAIDKGNIVPDEFKGNFKGIGVNIYF